MKDFGLVYAFCYFRNVTSSSISTIAPPGSGFLRSDSEMLQDCSFDRQHVFSGKSSHLTTDSQF